MTNCRRLTVFCLCSAFVATPTLGLCQASEDQAGIVGAPSADLRDQSRRGFLPDDQSRTDTEKMPGWADLVKPLKGDFRRLAMKENLAILQLGGLSALTFFPWDGRVKTLEWGEGSVHSALEPGALVGGFVFQSSAALATYAIGRSTGHTKLAQLGADLVRAQIVSQTVTQAVKFSTQRTRPDGTTLSFPSGHTASSFATASVVQAHFGFKAALPVYAMATWVAASRVQMKRHHVSDVIVGASVGLLAGRSVTFGRGSNRFSLSPMVVPGGGGVNLVHVGGRGN